MVWGSGYGKTNVLLNLINHETHIDTIYLYAKDPYEAQYQLLINTRESTGIKYLNDSKAFIEYWNDMEDIYKNIVEYIPNKKKRNIDCIWYDIIADMLCNKKLNSTVTELFITRKKKYFSCFCHTIKQTSINSINSFNKEIQ